MLEARAVGSRFRRSAETSSCRHGNEGNRIKEPPLLLFPDSTSCATKRAIELRVGLSGRHVRADGGRSTVGKKTEPQNAPCDTIRVPLLKSGARVKISVRRIRLSLSSAGSGTTLWQQELTDLQAHRPTRPRLAPIRTPRSLIPFRRRNRSDRGS